MPSIKHIPVQRTVLDGFEQMGLGDGIAGGAVGDGAGDFQDAVVATGIAQRFLPEAIAQTVSCPQRLGVFAMNLVRAMG